MENLEQLIRAKRELLRGINRTKMGDYYVSKDRHMRYNPIEESNESDKILSYVANKYFKDVKSLRGPEVTYTRDGFNNALKGLLSENEGTSVHYNKGENSVTLPYGFYIDKNKNTYSAKLFNDLANKYGLSGLNPQKQAQEFNKRANKIDKLDIANNSLNDLSNKYVSDSMLMSMSPKAIKAFADISINQGKYYPSKSIQKSIGETEDGILGSSSLNKLSQVKDYNKLTKDLYLGALQRANYLVKSNPERYAINSNGWTNRFNKGLNSI